MAKAKKNSAKEASNTFHNIMKASVKENSKSKIKNMKEVTLEDGSIALIYEAPANPDGTRRFMIKSKNGSFEMFSFTPDGVTQPEDGITESQKNILDQINKKSL
ncbi:MAG TPA: hypothetical protein PKE30_01260 [Niabella sp.]|nr:hypothetical protein [Niabella sp.]